MKKISGLLCIFLGLALAPTQGRADTCGTAANLVANCGFESGSFSSWTLSGNNVPGQEGNLYGVEGVDPFNGISPNSGSNQAFFGTLVSNSTTLTQTLATTAGDAYTVSFFIAQDTDPGTLPTESNAFTASFAGQTLVTLTGIPAQNYTEYSFVVDATSSSSLLSLTLGNDLGETLLDDVSVVSEAPVASTPEPPAWIFLLTGLLSAGMFWKSGVRFGTQS